MGLFSFLKRKKPPEGEESKPLKGEAPPPPPVKAMASFPPAPPRREPAREIERLARFGLPGGPTTDETLSLFHALRGTPDEAHAVEEMTRIAHERALPEDLLLVLGSTLVDRGEHEAATKVLSLATSSASLVLLADLAERRADYPNALALVERVLLRDLDHPGVRERHKRWRAQLGFDLDRKPVAAGTTMVAREPDAPYDLLREVGRGGAGAVYEAVDRELKRHVALKVYHQPERDRTQLAHEARVAVMLEGPHVVRVFDLDPDQGWIALEWARGGTLKDPIRARDITRLLPLERWAVPLAVALARAHAAGWVHHDVKPANVLLSLTGAAILTDFGTARRAGEPSPPGSLGYISPERMKGRASDPRDDVYGFGRVLEDVLEIVRQHEEKVAAQFAVLAAACTGPDDQRPADGRALLTRLRVELATGSS